MKRLFLSVFLVPLALADVSAQTSSPPLVITEIAAFESAGFEWIEILNIGGAEVEVGDFAFFEDGVAHKIAQGSLETGEFGVIAQDAERFLSAHAGFSGKVFDSSWGSLKESGEEIGLVDSAGNFLERFTYMSAPDFSLERIDPRSPIYDGSNWRENGGGTPGAQNGVAIEAQQEAPEETRDAPEAERPETREEPPPQQPCAAPLPQTPPPEAAQDPKTAPVSSAAAPQPKIFINEVSIKDSERDWIELYADERVDLTEYRLSNAAGTVFALPAQTVEEESYFVAELENGLPATTDVVILKNGRGEIVDAICYTNGEVAESKRKAIEQLLQKSAWHAGDPVGCIDTSSLKNNETIARVAETIDTDTPFDFQIFAHATKGEANLVFNEAPIAAITVQEGETRGEAPVHINVSGEESIDPDGDDLVFLWDFGDGEKDASANPKSHTYDEPGSYIITLTVSDPFGAFHTATLAVEATDPEVVPSGGAAAGPSAMGAGMLVAAAGTPQTGGSTAKQKSAQTKSSQPKSATIPPPQKSKKQTAKTPKKPEIQNGDLSTEIRISEVMPNPAKDEQEWIELFNFGDRSVNLGNWRLDDGEGGSKPFVFSNEFVAPPRSFFVLSKETVKLSLNNTGDSVRLFDFEGNAVDEFVYKNADAGRSFALINGEWQQSDEPTPGAPNPVYESFDGIIESIDEESRTITLAAREGAEKRTVFFKDTVLHPLMAGLALPNGAQAELDLEKKADGGLELKRINRVTPPLEPPRQNDRKWFFIGFLALACLANFALTVKTLSSETKEKARLFFERFSQRLLRK